MVKNSGISWTHHTFNPWIGCTKVSEACKFCYAERDMDKRLHKAKWGKNGTRVVTSESYWKEPIFWDRLAAKYGERNRVFCASLADVFEDWTGPMSNGSTMAEVRKRLFDLIDATPNLDWLLLTKRPENIRRMWAESIPVFDPEEEVLTHRSNVWLGTTVETQACAEARIPELRKCRSLSPVLFLSCEPLLDPVDLWPVAYKDCPRAENLIMDRETGVYECCKECDFTGISNEMDIDWVIAGGESGPEARPSHPNWFRSLRDQCAEADVAFHFKQWGEFTYTPADQTGDLAGLAAPMVLEKVGVKKAGRLLDGVEHNAVPNYA